MTGRERAAHLPGCLLRSSHVVPFDCEPPNDDLRPISTGREQSVVLCAIPSHHDHDYRDCPDLATGQAHDEWCVDRHDEGGKCLNVYQPGREQTQQAALRWVIEHKACSGFQQCWMAAPAEIREEIITTWGEDPWPLLAVPDTLKGEKW